MPTGKQLPQVLPAPQREYGSNTHSFTPLDDYQAVISQIKREVLIEISSFRKNGVRQNAYLAQTEQWNNSFSSLPDGEFNQLFNQAMLEARHRGLVARTETPLGNSVVESLVALLFLPSARQKLSQILQQTALEGIGLVERAKANILNMLGDELY